MNAPKRPSGGLEGHAAIVTGGGTGIGKACAAQLVADGAAVTICGRTEAKLAAAAAAIEAAAGHGGRVRYVVADVTDEADVQKWVEHMAGKLAPKSVADRHMLLHAMFAYGRAKSRGLVSHNPCLETELPTRMRKPPTGTTVSVSFPARTAASRA